MALSTLREHGGLLVFALTGALAAIVGAHVVAGGTQAFLFSGAYRIVLALTPDAVVAASIVVLGELGDRLALGLAVLLTFGLVGGAVAVGLVVGRRRESVPITVTLTSLLVTLVAVLLSGTSPTAIAAGFVAGASAGLAVAGGIVAGRLQWDASNRVPAGRRSALGSLATAVGIGLIGSVMHRTAPAVDTGDTSTSVKELDLSDAEQAAVESALATAREQSLDLEGMDPLVSDEFYEVDINQINPSVTREDWTLSVTGAVEHEQTIDFAALRDTATDHRFTTLRCVGESLNGHKMDNALWTGVPASTILDEATPQGQYVVLRAVDDYFEEFPLAALRDGFLAYGMNGTALPRRHGYPVRALIPGHWGEINVKWLTEIEVRDEPLKGYWERRGWHGTGPVNTVAKLHAASRDGDQIRIGGHTYAGTRGINRVEVSTDGGDSWAETTLSERLPGEDVWRQWEYSYPSPGEAHEVVVRAVDGTGTMQPRTRQNAFPSGATGWVSKRINPNTLE